MKDPINSQGDRSGLESLFTEIEAKTELAATPTGFEAEWMAREERWLKKRVGKITASKLNDLMAQGAVIKGTRTRLEWGQVAIKVMLAVAHERRTGVERPSLKGVKALEWGKTYEAEALEFYKKQTGIEMRSASFDFEDIVFIEPFEGFGDSPDGITDDGIGRAEIKCPESGAQHYEYTTIKEISEKDDYYWQFLGHLLDEKAEWCDFYSYDPRALDTDPLKSVIIRIWKMDHEFNLKRLRARIDKANKVINEALEKNDISIIFNINNL